MSIENKNENLISIEEFIARARRLGVDFGKGDPKNRLRYYVKIGLLPHLQRKSFNGLPPNGAYLESTLGILLEIDKKLKAGKSIQEIKREEEEKVFEKKLPKITTPHTYMYGPGIESFQLKTEVPQTEKEKGLEVKETPEIIKRKPFVKIPAIFRIVLLVLICISALFFTDVKINFIDPISYFLANVSEHVSNFRKLTQLPTPSLREEVFNFLAVESYLTVNAETAINAPLKVKEKITAPSFSLIRDEFEGRITVAGLTAEREYNFPDLSGAVCLATGNCIGLGGEVITLGGTPDRLAKFVSAREVRNSSISDLYLGGVAVTVDSAGNVGIGIEESAYPLHIEGRIQATGDICTDLKGGRCLSTLRTGGRGGGGIGGSGTANYLSIWTSSGILGNSILYQTGGNIGIGTTGPAATALLDLTSTEKGFLAPRMTEAQRDAISSPATGLFIYNTDTNQYNVYNGTSWDALGGAASWSDLTDPTANLSLSMGAYTTVFNWVTGTGTDDLFSLTTDASANGTGSLLNLQTGTSSTVNPLRVRAGSTEALFVDSTGSVGIGDTTPDAVLDIDTSATSGTIFGITSTGVQTIGDLVNWTADSLTTADVLDISAAALTTGTGINISGGGTAALTSGSLLRVTGPTGAAALSGAAGGVVNLTAAGAYTSADNAGLLNLNSGTATGVVQAITANALITGTALIIPTTSTGLTTGNLLSLSSTGATTAFTGSLANISFAGNNAGNTGQLLKITQDAPAAGVEFDVDIPPSDDSYTYSYLSGTNYGSETTLKIYKYTSWKQPFIKFSSLSDIPAESNIISATLYLYCVPQRAMPSWDFYRNDADWDEDTITYDNKPDITGTSLGSIDLSTTGWKTLDITDLAQGWVDGTENNYGLQMYWSAGDVWGAEVRSKEYTGTDYDPYLKVNYIVPNQSENETIPLMVTNLGAGISFRVNDGTGDADSTPFVIDSSGNVGIGTATPSSFKLQIAGSLGPDADNQYDLGSATARWRDLYLGPSSLNIYNTTGADAEYFTIGYDATPTISFSSLANGSGTARNFNFTGGNVGIGDTSPASLLTVGSGDLFQVDSSGDIVKIKNLTYSWPSSHTADGFLKDDGSGALTWTTIGGAGGVTGSGTAGYLPKWDTSTDLTDSVLYETGGSVGIGTTTPSVELEVLGKIYGHSSGQTSSSKLLRITHDDSQLIETFDTPDTLDDNEVYGQFTNQEGSSGDGSVSDGKYNSYKANVSNAHAYLITTDNIGSTFNYQVEFKTATSGNVAQTCGIYLAASPPTGTFDLDLTTTFLVYVQLLRTTGTGRLAVTRINSSADRQHWNFSNNSWEAAITYWDSFVDNNDYRITITRDATNTVVEIYDITGDVLIETITAVNSETKAISDNAYFWFGANQLKLSGASTINWDNAGDLSASVLETEKLYIKQNGDVYIAGNVGIGDTTPDATLDIDTSATSGTIFGITSTGVQTSGDLVNWTANSLTTADVLDISASALTTGNGINISGGGTTALTSGSLLRVTGPTGAAALSGAAGGIVNLTAAGAYTSADNAGLLNLNSGTATGVVQAITANALITGTALIVPTTSTGLTTGSLLSLSSTGATTAFTGALANISFAGDNAGNTGQLLKISQSAGANLTTPLMITNLGAGISFRVNDETGDEDTTPFVIDTSGNVGIGTTNPSSFKLQIAGNLGPDADNQYDLGSATARWRDLYLGPSSLNIYSTTGADAEYFTIGYDATPTISFSSLANGSGTARNFSFTGGNVGIGTTSPTSLFSVGSSSQFQVDSSGDIVKLKNLTYSWPSAHTTNGFLKDDGSGTLTWTTIAGAGGVTGSGTAGYLPKWDTSTALTDSILYETSGKIGVATASPGVELDIAGQVRITNTTTSQLSVRYDANRYLDTILSLDNETIFQTGLSSFLFKSLQATDFWAEKSDWDVSGPADPRPAFADLDNDLDYDLLIGVGTNGSVPNGYSYAYENTGTVSSPTWTRKGDWDPPDAGKQAAPAFADLDNDLDYDLLIGTENGISIGYENTGTVSSPTWAVKSDWNVPDVGDYSRPAFADLDNDLDYDLLIGEYSGISYGYENTGTVSSPTWIAKSSWDAPDVSAWAGPALADLDNDGDYDLLVGNQQTYCYGYENTGGGGQLTTRLVIDGDGNVGIGTTNPTAKFQVVQTATATGELTGIVYTGAVNTDQTLSTEIPAVTITTAGRQWATGALTTQREVLITAPTYSFVGASTITDAATLAVAGAPIAGTNATLTNTHGLLIQAGAVAAGATNSYGLTVNTQTGATNNYTAAFLGGNVGIGMATPAYALDVYGTLRSTATTALATVDGNVGIGTTNPSVKLEVLGKIYGRTSGEGASSKLLRIFNAPITLETFDTDAALDNGETYGIFTNYEGGGSDGQVTSGVYRASYAATSGTYAYLRTTNNIGSTFGYQVEALKNYCEGSNYCGVKFGIWTGTNSPTGEFDYWSTSTSLLHLGFYSYYPNPTLTRTDQNNIKYYYNGTTWQTGSSKWLGITIDFAKEYRITITRDAVNLTLTIFNVTDSVQTGTVTVANSDCLALGTNTHFWFGYPKHSGGDPSIFDFDNAGPQEDVFEVDKFYVKQSGDAYIAGNLGIGTTAPTANLDVKGNLNTALTGTVAVTSLSTAVVGTGTAFTTELIVGDAIKIKSEIFTVSEITGNLNLTLDSAYQGDTESGLVAYKDSNLFYVQDGDAAGKMVIDKSGNVGIGTASPSHLLHLSETTTAAGGDTLLRVTGLHTDDTAMTGTLRGAYIDISNGILASTGTIRGMELKARTEAPGDEGNDVAVLEGLSISADSKDHSVTTMRAAEFILDGSTGGTITEAVGLRIANNLQADKATISYGLQLYADSFNYDYGIYAAGSDKHYFSGNVGIGTESPFQKLTIAGDLSSTLKAGYLSTDNVLLSSLEGGMYFGRVGVKENQWGLANYGNTWTAKDSDRSWLGVAMSSDGKVQTAADGAPGQIYVSTDYGNTWTAKDSNRYWRGVVMSSDGKIQTAVVVGGQIYVSYADSFIYGGNVGIGTMNPTYPLHIYSGGVERYRFDTDGTAYADVAWSTFSPYISMHFIEGEKEDYEIGELIVISEDKKVSKTSLLYQNTLLGVVAEKAGFISYPHNWKEEMREGNLELDEFPGIPVAYLGDVPVKVSLEGGEITVGDPLTSSSESGIAMKSTEPGRVIGMALEPFNGTITQCETVITGNEETAKNEEAEECTTVESEIGKIMVFVNPHWSLGQLLDDGSLATSDDNEQLIDNNETSSETLEEQPTILDQFTLAIKKSLEKLGLLIKDGIVKVRELIAEKIFAKKLCLEGDDGETICVDKNQLEELLMKNQIQSIDSNSGSSGEGSDGNSLSVSNTDNSGSDDLTDGSTPDVCDATHLTLCTTQAECETAAGFWYNEGCNTEPKSEEPAVEEPAVEEPAEEPPAEEEPLAEEPPAEEPPAEEPPAEEPAVEEPTPDID